jgi:hypothetical protein
MNGEFTMVSNRDKAPQKLSEIPSGIGKDGLNEGALYLLGKALRQKRGKPECNGEPAAMGHV